MKRFVVDRIEGDIAVLEAPDLAFEDHKLSDLPFGLKRGDCLIFENGEWSIDPDETELRRQRIKSLMDKVFSKE